MEAAGCAVAAAMAKSRMERIAAARVKCRAEIFISTPSSSGGDRMSMG
jgi:hypothetical protein